MLELALQLEYKRQAFRRKLLGRLANLDRAYPGLAIITLLFYIFVITPEVVLVFPTAPVLPFFIPVPFAFAIAAFVLMGLALALTVVLFPVSLIFF